MRAPKYNPTEYKSKDVGFHGPGFWLRPAIIQDVDASTGLVKIEWLDYPGMRSDVEVSQPQLGIFQMPTVGTAVLIGFDQGFRAKILRHIPLGYAQQLETGEIPSLRPGELLFQSYLAKPLTESIYPSPSATGTHILLNNIGDITMQTATGDRWTMDNIDNEINQKSMNFTCSTEAGVMEFGLVKRTLSDQLTPIKKGGGKFTSTGQNGLTEFRLRLLETADINSNTDPVVNTDPFIELTMGTKIDNTGTVVTTDSNHAVENEEKMIQLKTKADQGFEFTVDKEGNVTLLVKGDVKVKVDGSANIEVDHEASVIAGSKVIVDAPTIEVGGTTGVVLSTFLTHFDTHTHSSNSPGLPSSPPVVQSLPMHKTKKVKAG